MSPGSKSRKLMTTTTPKSTWAPIRDDAFEEQWRRIISISVKQATIEKGARHLMADK
jgi:hypothetical protein